MIGERIRELRENNGLTQSVLARKLGLSRSAVNAWEMGLNIPTTQYIVELARIFKVPTDYILCMNQQELVDISALTPGEKEYIYGLVEYFSRYRHAVSFYKRQAICLPVRNSTK